MKALTSSPRSTLGRARLLPHGLPQGRNKTDWSRDVKEPRVATALDPISSLKFGWWLPAVKRLRLGRFRGAHLVVWGPGPSVTRMFSRGGALTFLRLACLSVLGSGLLGNHVPKRRNLAEICGCERLLGFFFVESTDSGDITPGQIFRSRSRSQNHRSQPQISAIFS